MHRPNGMPPMEIFHLENQHYGVRTAIFPFYNNSSAMLISEYLDKI